MEDFLTEFFRAFDCVRVLGIGIVILSVLCIFTKRAPR